MKRHTKRLTKKARSFAQKLGKLMGVRAIFLSGSVAEDRANKDSDIDFFFIAQKDQIWTARFFVFVWLKCHKEIKTKTKHAGKICPNHFITDDSLEIKEKDAYSAQLFSHNIPLYDPDNIFPIFAQKNQPWVQDFGKSFDCTYLTPHTHPIPHSKRHMMGIRFLECILAKLQKTKIKSNPESRLPGAKIILTEHELRFHPKPKSIHYQHRNH